MSSNPRPSAGAYGAFLVTRRGTDSLTADQVRSVRFLAPSRGVRLPADTADPIRARAAGVLLAAAAPAALCDLTAARHWSLPLPFWAEDTTRPIGSAVPAARSRQDRVDVRGRRLLLPPAHLTTHLGLAVTTPARTWVDCAEFLPLVDLIVLGDAILHRNLATLSDLDALVRWAHGRRGVVSARRALRLVAMGAASPGESRARATLVLGGIAQPLCNVDIIEDGDWLARADMAWLVEKVIVEYDGRVHENEGQRRKDALRRNLLQDRGWLIIVFTAADLRHPERMVALVRSALQSRRVA